MEKFRYRVGPIVPLAGPTVRLPVYVKPKDEPVERCLVSVKPKDEPAEAVIGSAELQLAVLVAAERDLKAFQTRYRELVDVCKLVEEARSAVNRRRENLERVVALRRSSSNEPDKR